MKITLLILTFLSVTVQAVDWNLVLRKQIENQWPRGSKITVTLMKIPNGIDAKAQIRVTNSDAPIGLVPVEWVWSNNGVPARQYGTATVQVRTLVAVAAVPLSHGQSLDAERTRFIEHEVSPLFHTGFFTQAVELERRKVRGYVAPGAVLNARNTTAPMLVEAGQTVSLAQVLGALQITARMESLESGARGDWVRISHPKTRKIMRARVTGLGHVELN
jgi:flagellar basal body P-ring formation protein FlgA